MLDSLAQDFRYALRHLRRSPGFAAAALLTLALAIGANSATFTVVHVLVLRPIPVEDPAGLIAISGVNEERQRRLTPIPAIEVLLRDGPLDHVCGYNAGAFLPIEANGVPTQATGGLVTGRCFEAFGVPPLLGRTIDDRDAPIYSRGSLVTVISYGLWSRLFNRDPAAIGKRFRVEGVELEIIGIMPEGFLGLSPHSQIEFYAPFDTWSPARPDRRPAAPHIVGRLKPGISFQQASQQIEAGWPALIEFAAPATMAPAERQSMLATRARVERFTTGYSISRELYSQPVWLMFALTAVLLLLACLNLGGLLLSRAMARAQEIAMKLALGSGRWRIARQVVIENLVLSVGGALLAIPVTFGLVAVIVSLMPEVLTVAGTRFTPDAFVIAATSVVGVAAGFVISILPIWMAGSARAFISVGVNRTVAPATAHWTRVLVVAQVAMSMALVVGAGLLGRSLYRLQQADTGIRAEGVSVARLRPLPNAYNTLNYAAYYPPLFEAIAALPGVQSAGYSRGFPSGVLHLFPGEVAAFVGDPDGNIRAHFEAVSPGFFETLGASLLRGRLFTWADNEKSPPIAVVTEQLARQLQPDGSVVGRRIRVGAIPLNQNVEIVGVVRNITMGHSRRTDLPMVFRPGLQIPLYARYPSFVIRHDTQALTGIAAGLRDIAAKGGREFLHDIRPLPDLLERAPASERMSAAVAMTLAALAAVLAFVGVFGVLAYAVSRRTREIGVRAAVGAAPASVMWMVMREGALLAAIGVAIGIPAAYYSSRLLSSLTFGVSPVDPLTFASAAVFLVVLGVGAGLVPARRAARIDPVIALRAE